MLGFLNLALFLAYCLIAVPVVGLLSAFFFDWLRVRYAPAPEYAEETFVMNFSASLALPPPKMSCLFPSKDSMQIPYRCALLSIEAKNVTEQTTGQFHLEH